MSRSFPRPRAGRSLRTVSLALVVLALALAGSSLGCGSRSSGSGDDDGGEHASPGRMAFDEGPADTALAAKGRALFTTKGCSACHAFGRRVTGPDLAGVTRRRTKDWIMHMVEKPDEMTKTDPIARELLGTYAVQMPRLNLTEDEAEAVVEFFKTQEAPTGAN